MPHFSKKNTHIIKIYPDLRLVYFRMNDKFMSLTGVDFTSHSRPVFTMHSRSVFTRRDRPVFTTHRRPVFTTVAESLPRPQWERNSEHGADPHEYLHRDHLPIASQRK